VRGPGERGWAGGPPEEPVSAVVSRRSISESAVVGPSPQSNTVSALGRADVVEILAGFHSRPAGEIPERIDSMEVAWLVHQVEQRYDLRIELSDSQLGRMGTVSGAVDVLREVIETVRNG
jgi:hypothetical protein